MRVAFFAALCALSRSATPATEISDTFLGTWTPITGTAVHSPLGPSWPMQHFAMSKNTSNGDYWMSAIQGQVFAIKDGLMQYCFAGVVQSPFTVDSIEKNKLVFCYKTGDRMPSHKRTASGALATGCDAATITVEILSNGNLEFTFLMSPPAKHAWAVFERTGEAPAISTYHTANKNVLCDPTHPAPPTLAIANAPMCPGVAVAKDQVSLSKAVATTEEAGAACRQMDSSSRYTAEPVDVRLQYTVPKSSCWPCNVSYSISAAIPEDQYISVGFKGMAYRAYAYGTEERPAYFGMATDALDDTRTSRVIVLGYAQSAGGCVREMKAENYVGTPIDVKGNPHLIDESVERLNGRTVVRFTIKQHVGRTTKEIDTFFNGEQVCQRVMWAIGDVNAEPPARSWTCTVCAHDYNAEADGGGLAFEDLPETWLCPVCGQPKSVYQLKEFDRSSGSDCSAGIQYHDGKRGVSPLAWFNANPYCSVDRAELGVEVEEVVVA